MQRASQIICETVPEDRLRYINAVSFLTAAQRDRYGRYPDVVTPNDLSRCFHLSDDDRAQIMSCRGHHNRLGFALQLSTVRYLGTFLDDPIAVPSSVLQSLSHQLDIHTLDGLQSYRNGEQREEHVTKIRKRYGYGDITEPRVGFRMTRWLYGVCWTGTEFSHGLDPFSQHKRQRFPLWTIQ